MALLNELLNIIRTIRINDILDMAIMAFIIYKVLFFLARTGSGRVLKGVLLLLAVMLVANKLELYMVNFVFGKTFELGVLALLIVFQPELRSLLEKVGGITKYIQSREGSQDLEGAIGEVLRACEEMSRSRQGALIVFQRDNVLSEQISNGTIINADTREELLKNLFYEGSPLHDGAVIIRDGRIAAASCMLPLTESKHLRRELGMRHRAAIGMSERSDAVCVVVSEETGAISVAVDGMLKPHLAMPTFEKILRMELLKDTEDGPNKNFSFGFIKDKINEKNHKNRTK